MVDNKKTITSFFWVFVEKFGYSGLSFFSTIILARLLTPNDFGLLGTITIFVSVSNMLVEAGFGAALIQKQNITDRDYSTIFVFNIIMSFILYVALFIAAPYISIYYNNDVFTSLVRVLGLLLFINAITLTQRVHLIRELNFKTQTYINITSLLLSIFLSISLAYYGYGVWALIAQLISYSLFSSLFMIIKVQFRPKILFDIGIFKELFKFGGSIIINSILNVVYNDIFGLIISKKYSINKTGLYTQANKLVSFPTGLFTSLFDSAGFPILSRIKEPLEFKRVLSNINRGIFSIAIPLLVIIPFQSKAIVDIVLGEQWIESANILSILSISLLTSLISVSSSSTLKALGRGKEILRYGVFKIVLGLCILAISIQISFDAMLYGIVATNIIFSIIIFHVVTRHTLYKWRDLYKDFGESIIAVILINIVVTFVLSKLQLSGSFISLSIFVLLVLSLYFMYIMIFNKDMLIKLLSNIRRK